MSDANIRAKFRTLLENRGYVRADALFTFDNVPDTTADRAFIIDRNRAGVSSEAIAAAQSTLYLNIEVAIRILFKIEPFRYNDKIDSIHDDLETVIKDFLDYDNFPTGVALVNFLRKVVVPESSQQAYVVAELIFNVQDRLTFG